MSENMIQPWLKDGDEQAAEALYQAHRSRVYRLAYALLGNGDEAELVMQETIAYALANIQDYAPERVSFDTWLHTITVSRSRDRGMFVRGQADTASPQASQSQIWQVLGQINAQLREAIVLRYWGGHTYPELAQILRCPLPTAQSRVRLGYEQMTQLLASAGGPTQGNNPAMDSANSPTHVTDAELIAYAHQQLTESERETVDGHLEGCLECRRRLLAHADEQRRISEELKRELAQVHPNSDWSVIAPQLRPPGAEQGGDPQFTQKRKSRRRVYAALFAIYAIAVLLGGYVIFTIVRDSVREQESISLVEERPTATTAPPPTQAIAMATATSNPSNNPSPTPELVGPPIWDGEGRVNLLLLGIDQRGDRQGHWRTDTMIIVTIDPDAQTVGIISVPRDLWVPIWGYDIDNRINTAHYYGSYYGYPGGGPALARDTVSYNLGIPIHHYVRINFTAFEKLIDEIGGIDVYAEKTINDPRYPDEAYGYDPFYLPAGQHHLDGETALKYARSRHGTGDFDRAKRQQQVIIAARDQVIQLDQMPRLISNGLEILNTLGDSVQTDLTFDQSVQLARIVSNISSESYQGAVIDRSYTQAYTTDTGAQVLIPLRDKIAKLYESFFDSP